MFSSHSFTMLLKLFSLALLLERTSYWVASNETNGLAMVEQGYLNWVNFKQHAPNLKHSLFQKAKNKFKPCKTIKVNKNIRIGNFVTVQKAINSLPVINLCRLIIFISAGTYRYFLNHLFNLSSLHIYVTASLTLQALG